MRSQTVSYGFAKLRQNIISRAIKEGMSVEDLFLPSTSLGKRVSPLAVISTIPGGGIFSLPKTKMSFSRTGSKKAAEMFYNTCQKIGTSCRTILVLAGEFNYVSYSYLVEENKFDDLIKNLRLNVLVIGGPYLSVKDNRVKNSNRAKEINSVLYLAQENLIQLFIKKDKREVGHFIVGSNTDRLTLQEDPHLEYQDWNTHLYYNDEEKCSELRSRFFNLLTSDSLFLWNRKLDSIRDRLKTMEELKKLSLH